MTGKDCLIAWLNEAQCEQIRLEDEEMARWIQQNLPMLVQQTLQQVTG